MKIFLIKNIIAIAIGCIGMLLIIKSFNFTKEDIDNILCLVAGMYLFITYYDLMRNWVWK